MKAWCPTSSSVLFFICPTGFDTPGYSGISRTFPDSGVFSQRFSASQCRKLIIDYQPTRVFRGEHACRQEATAKSSVERSVSRSSGGSCANERDRASGSTCSRSFCKFNASLIEIFVLQLYLDIEYVDWGMAIDLFYLFCQLWRTNLCPSTLTIVVQYPWHYSSITFVKSSFISSIL